MEMTIRNGGLSHAGFALLAGAILAVGASAARAGDAEVVAGTDTVAIRAVASDADLNTLGGTRSLAMRIRVAAAAACGGDDWVMRFSDNFLACRQELIDGTAGRLSAPMLVAALHSNPVRVAANRR